MRLVISIWQKVLFTLGGVVLSYKMQPEPPLGTTWGRPSDYTPPPFHQVFMCCLQESLNIRRSADWSSVSSLRQCVNWDALSKPKRRRKGRRSSQQGGAAVIERCCWTCFYHLSHWHHLIDNDNDNHNEEDKASKEEQLLLKGVAKLVSITFIYSTDTN